MKLFQNKWWWILIVVILAWPLFFLNITNQLDWGDDNSKYLEQAQQLAEGQLEVKTNYIFNAKYFLGPKYYPNGFPLLLAAWSKIAGFSVLSFNYLNVWLIMLAGIFIFLLTARFFSPVYALLICLAFYYHPGIMQIKQDVLSELAYLACSLIVLWLLPQRKTVFSLVGGLLLGYLVHIRVVGFSICCVYAIYVLQQFFLNTSQEHRTNTIKQTGIYILGFLISYGLVKFLFPVSSSYHFFELDYNVFKTTLTHLGDNFFYYTEPFFGLPHRELRFISLLTGSVFLFSAFYGWLLAMLRKDENLYLHYYTAIYILVICFFKHGDAGFRFLIPVFPFLLIYAAICLKQWMQPFAFIKPLVWQTVVMVLLFVQFIPHYHKGLSVYSKPVLGPNDAQAQGLFAYVSKHTSEKDIIAFAKPRAMSYFTKRKSVFAGRLTSTYELMRKVKKRRFDYFVFYWGLNDQHDLKVISADSKNWKVVYQNKRAVVYKRLL